jgi:hypothetical protein
MSAEPGRCAKAPDAVNLDELRSLVHRVASKTVGAKKCGLPSFGDLCAMASQKN